MKLINLNDIEIVIVDFQNIKKKLFFNSYNYFNVFDRA